MKFRSPASSSAVLFGVISLAGLATGQVRTLSFAPATVQPGNTFVMTASGFPMGVSGVNVTARFAPVTSGAGPTATAPLVSLTTLAGTTLRAMVVIPPSLVETGPTPYHVTLSATVAPTFTTATPGNITIDPAPSLWSANPASGQQGQTIDVSITGSFTNLYPGISTANLGPGITVNSVSVTSPAGLTANITIASGATLGATSVIVTTGSEVDTLTDGFTILAGQPTIIPAPYFAQACQMTQDRNALLPSWVAAFVPLEQVYVSPSGSDFNNGLTPLTPLQSTAAAFAKAGPGVRLNFAAGTYSCNASLSNINGGPGSPVMIYASDGPGTAQFNCNGGSSLLIDTVHGLIVEGIEIYNANGHGFHIQTTNPAPDGSNLSSDIVVHNTTIHDVTLAAIKNSQSIRFYAIGDTFYNTPGGMMVESVAASNVILSNNEGYNGLAFDEIKGGAQGGVIYRNCVHDAPNGIIAGGDETGTQFLIDPNVTYEAQNLQIRDNVIINTPGFVFRIVGCQYCTIANNSAWTSAPQAVLRIQPDDFVNPDGSLIPVYNSNLTIVNNLFGADTNSAYMITGDTTDQGVGSPGFNFSMTNNCWWWGTGPAPATDINYLGDPASLYFVDPLVTSSPSDLVPLESSPLIGQGIVVPFVKTNADGEPFANPPNIGAY